MRDLQGLASPEEKVAEGKKRKKKEEEEEEERRPGETVMKKYRHR